MAEAPGLFETLGLFDGALPLWDLHLARMAEGAQRLGIRFDYPHGLRDASLRLLRERGDDVLRITLTPGHMLPLELTTRRRDAREPVRLMVARDRRDHRQRHAELKSTERSFFERVLEDSRNADADDAVILDSDGRVLETTRCNLFLVRGGELCTPARNGLFLPGIARALLLERTQVREADLTEEDLRASDAILVSNAVHGPRFAVLDRGGGARVGNPLLAPWREALAALRSGAGGGR